MLFLQPINESEVAEITTADILAECIQYQLEVMEENEALFQADYLFHSTLDESAEDAGEKKAGFGRRVIDFIKKQILRISAMFGRIATWVDQLVKKLINKFRKEKNILAPKGTARLDTAIRNLSKLMDRIDEAIKKGTKGGDIESSLHSSLDPVTKEVAAAMEVVEKSLADGVFSDVTSISDVNEMSATAKADYKRASELKATATASYGNEVVNGDMSKLRETVTAQQRAFGVYVRAIHLKARALLKASSNTRKEGNAS